MVKTSPKNDKFGYLNPVLGKLGLTHNLGWWLVGQPMVNFLFVLIELFSLYITVTGLWGKMCTAWLFPQGVNLFAHKFYLDRIVPHQPFLATENWATRWWKPHPSAFPHVDTIPECDGRTDLPYSTFVVSCNKTLSVLMDVVICLSMCFDMNWRLKSSFGILLYLYPSDSQVIWSQSELVTGSSKTSRPINTSHVVTGDQQCIYL